VRASHAGERT